MILCQVSDGWVTQGGSGITQSLYYGLKFDKIDEDLRNILMRCTTCRSCEIICERLMAGVKLVDAIHMGRQLLFELEIPPIREQQKALDVPHPTTIGSKRLPDQLQGYCNRPVSISGSWKMKNALVILHCKWENMDYSKCLKRKMLINLGTQESRPLLLHLLMILIAS